MLKKSPSQAELNQLTQSFNSGNYQAAESMAAALSKTYPKSVYLWKILGVALASQSKMTKAISPLKKAVELAPKDSEAHRNLAMAYNVIEKNELAEAHFRKTIALNPQDVLAYTPLARILDSQKKFTEAEKICRKAITLKYDAAEIHDQLGVTLLRQKKLSEAENSFKTAILLAPHSADFYNNLGLALNEQGKFLDAESNYRHAIKIRPEFSNAYCNLAKNLSDRQQLLEAESAYRKAIEINDQNHIALTNLGALLYKSGKLKEAKKYLEKALDFKPDFASALNNIANTLKDMGELKTALDYYQKAFTADPTMTLAYSNFLLIAGYHAQLNQDQSLKAAKLFGKSATGNAKIKYRSWLCPLIDKSTTTKIRIGFVSGDFRKHAVMFFLERLLTFINKNEFELIAYTTNPHEDEVTALIKPHFIKWQPIYGKNDQDTAEIIHQDGVHILFDLSGHTAHNRLPVFAYKPAPIQVTWAGYPATTGLNEMDYILADEYLVPFDQEQQFVEKVWRFPEVSGCFAPLIEDIPIEELPAIKNGHITFGCLNNIIKMNDDVVAVWSQVLHAVPNSKLFLQATPLSEPSVLQKTYDRYAAHGIKPEQLILEGKTPRLDYFKSYNKIDIALDPFPCPGGTTTADTLWMSVPVLTLKGYNYWSRFGEAIAKYVGQTDWVAEDKQDYVRKAAIFAGDIELLKEMRKTLRAKVLASPLFDAPRFTRNFESVLKGMLEKWKQDNQ